MYHHHPLSLTFSHFSIMLLSLTLTQSSNFSLPICHPSSLSHHTDGSSSSWPSSSPRLVSLQAIWSSDHHHHQNSQFTYNHIMVSNCTKRSRKRWLCMIEAHFLIGKHWPWTMEYNVIVFKGLFTFFSICGDIFFQCLSPFQIVSGSRRLYLSSFQLCIQEILMKRSRYPRSGLDLAFSKSPYPILSSPPLPPLSLSRVKSILYERLRCRSMTNFFVPIKSSWYRNLRLFHLSLFLSLSISLFHLHIT